MKKTLTILTCLYSLLAGAQDFAPVGARWYYTEKQPFSPAIGYLKVESVKDTVIGGRSCHMLSHDMMGCAHNYYEDYVYTEDSVVYFYNREVDSFEILYNFKAREGESWTIHFNLPLLDSIEVMVDFVEFETINGKNLKSMYVEYRSHRNSSAASPWCTTTNSIIYQTLGDISFMFNHLVCLSGCDLPYSAGLRCYLDDPSFGNYSKGNAPSCTYTTGLQSPETETIGTYPNPASTHLTVEMGSAAAVCELKNMNGRLLLAQTGSGNISMDMQDLSPGVYLLTITVESGMVINRKIVKQ